MGCKKYGFYYKRKILLCFSLNSRPQRWEQTQFWLVIVFFKFFSLCAKTGLLLTFSKWAQSIQSGVKWDQLYSIFHKTESLHDTTFLKASVICLYTIWCCKNNKNLRYAYVDACHPWELMLWPQHVSNCSPLNQKNISEFPSALVSLLYCLITPQKS